MLLRIFFFSRKDEECMLNRHNQTYYPQTVHRVPSVSDSTQNSLRILAISGSAKIDRRLR